MESKRYMDSDSGLNIIITDGIVAGMRGAFPPEVALRVSEILMGEGITAFEMMMKFGGADRGDAGGQSRVWVTRPA